MPVKCFNKAIDESLLHYLKDALEVFYDSERKVPLISLKVFHFSIYTFALYKIKRIKWKKPWITRNILQMQNVK